MTVAQFLTDYKPKNTGGFSLGSDFVLAIGKGDSPLDYLVFSQNASEVKASVVSDMLLRKYVLRGGSYHRHSAVRKFSVTMFRRDDDPLFSMLCSLSSLFGTEKEAVFDYVYFNVRTGIGEKGTVSADVFCDMDGLPDTPAVLSADFFGCGGIPEFFSIGGGNS